jgi:glycosyltransferase involved in cell wall biosynthesis
MKLIFVSRLFSSVENFLCHGASDVNGMPTVTKFLRKASEVVGHTEWIILVSRQDFKRIDDERVRALRDNLGVKKITFWNVNNMFGKFYYFISCLILANNKDIIYIHNSAFWLGAIKIFRKSLTVNLRITGMPKGIYSVFQFRTLKNMVKRIAYTQNYDNIIFTEDGGAHCDFANELGGKNSKRYYMRNGCDIKYSSDRENKKIKKITFLGRFHWTKGLQDFLDLAVACNELEGIHFVIAGYGEEQYKIDDYKYLHSLKFHKNPTRDDVEEILNDTHILVSPNRSGFLSNVVLEGLKSGAIILSFDGCYPKGTNFSKRAEILELQNSIGLNTNMFFYKSQEDLEDKLRNLISTDLKYLAPVDIQTWQQKSEKELAILLDGR